LWRDGSGNPAIWFMIGTQVFTSAPVGNVSTTWSVVGVADFNGDGLGDLLWRDLGGNTAVWLLNGASVMSTGYVWLFRSLLRIQAPARLTPIHHFNDLHGMTRWRKIGRVG
jgi:hypothetical protein